MMNHYGTSRTYCTGIYDNQNNRELQNSNQIITELNALHDENEQLKQQLQSILKLTKKIEDCTHDIKVIGDVE